MVNIIPLTRGCYTILDEEDYHRFKIDRWYTQINANSCYAYRTEKANGKKFELGLHRAVLGLGYEDGVIVDHINRNTLDNRKCNLRITDKRGNSINRQKIRRDTSSVYKGVSFDKQRNNWQAYIKDNGIRISLGRYGTELEAAEAYDLMAKRLFGELACLNLSGEIKE